MTPKISLELRPKPKDAAFVFFLAEDEKPSTHPLFRFLEKTEKEYLKSIQKNLRLKEKELKVLVGPDLGRKMLFIGTGKRAQFTPIKAGLAVRVAIQAAKRERAKKIAVWTEPLRSPAETKLFFENIAANAVMANFEFVKYKTPPEDGFIFVEEIQAISDKANAAIRDGLERGTIIGEEINNCRALANTPGADMTPRLLAAHAVKASKDLGIRTTILDKAKIEKLGMGGVIGVSKGSEEPPQFIIMEYLKGPKTQKPVVLVGKGVTFDTGGLNLKPSTAIYEMHMDMSGGAAVIHSIRAAARLKLKKNIVGLIPAVENMPSGSSYRPGDLLRTMSGTTIEVLDTDAEGRVILSDALAYAQKYKPALVVDLATLTGAAMVALGQRFSALFATDKTLEEKFRRLGEETGDRVWPLPLFADYEEEIRGTFGDVANIGKTRYGGAITGAVFLWQFTKNKNSEQAYPWVHLDIAPRMTTIEGEYLARGAAGAGVFLLTRLLEE